MNNKNIGRSALYLSMILALAACGGTDSHTDNGGGNGVPGAKIELDPNGYSARQASINEWTDVEAATQVYTQVLSVSYLGLIEEIEERIDDSWADPTSSGNRHTWSCENGAGTAVAAISRGSSHEQVQWQFSNCEIQTDSYDRLLLDGTYQYLNQLVSRSPEGANLIGSEYFQVSGTFLTSNDAFKLQGRTDWDEFYATDAFASVHRIGALELVRGDHYLALSDVTVSFAGDDDGDVFTLKGKVISSAINGYVTISTPAEISQPNGMTCPEKGLARITGQDNSYAEIRYGADSGTSDAAVVEINGSRAKALTCPEAGRIL